MSNFWKSKLSILKTISKMPNSSKTNIDMGVKGSVEPGHPLPSDAFPGSWKLWIVAGMVVTVTVPFWKKKLGPLLKFEKEVETAVDIADEVLEMVEKVADDVEKVADDIGDHLPEGTQLRKADLFVENVAKEIVKDANLAEQFIHKVEDVETYVESFIDRTRGQ